VIPRHLAASVAQDTFEQDHFENWALDQVKSGASIRGVYPPDEEGRARYEAWRAGQG
jgi:hypothetical protein